jgi:hypothetical protein
VLYLSQYISVLLHIVARTKIYLFEKETQSKQRRGIGSFSETESQEITAIHGTWKIITRVCHWILSWTKWNIPHLHIVFCQTHFHIIVLNTPRRLKCYASYEVSCLHATTAIFIMYLPWLTFWALTIVALFLETMLRSWNSVSAYSVDSDSSLHQGLVRSCGLALSRNLHQVYNLCPYILKLKLKILPLSCFLCLHGLSLARSSKYLDFSRLVTIQDKPASLLIESSELY